MSERLNELVCVYARCFFCDSAAIDQYISHNVAQHAREMEPKFLGGLHDIASHRRFVGEVRGLGLMAAVELTTDRETKAPLPMEWEMSKRMMQVAAEKGLLIRGLGHGMFVMSPSLIMVERMAKCLR